MNSIVVLLVLCLTSSLAVGGHTDCYMEGQSPSYNGQSRVTEDGQRCLEWNLFKARLDKDAYFPEGSAAGASYYCRDPDNSGRPWCYGSDTYEAWCDVSVCSTSQK